MPREVWAWPAEWKTDVRNNFPTRKGFAQGLSGNARPSALRIRMTYFDSCSVLSEDQVVPRPPRIILFRNKAESCVAICHPYAAVCPS